MYTHCSKAFLMAVFEVRRRKSMNNRTYIIQVPLFQPLSLPMNKERLAKIHTV